MATGSMIGLAPVMIMLLLGLWWDVHSIGFFSSEEYHEASFRETGDRVVAWVEAYRCEHGHLPDSLMVGGLMTSGGYDVGYIDTTKWNCLGFYYFHWGDSVYAIELAHGIGRYLSTPVFEGYLFYRWDEEMNGIRVDTVVR